MLAIIKQYKNHDIAFWGIIFSIHFYKNFTGTIVENRYWNIKVEDKAIQLESTLALFRSLDAERYINVKKLDKNILKKAPSKLGLPEIDKDIAIPHMPFDDETTKNVYEVRLTKIKPFYTQKAKFIHKYTDITVLKSSGYFSFLDTKELCTSTGLDKITIADMLSNKTEISTQLRQAIYTGYTRVKLCPTLHDAKLLVAIINHILEGGAKVYLNDEVVYE